MRLQEFVGKWGADYPTIVKSWRSNLVRITSFFEYPPVILWRTVRLRKHIWNHASFS
jgi:transposase-like protein